ncbi:MAG: hypothetical protein HYT94_01765 [Parcubacteria group bacterium]|nr:hypothetical protein [Parcubacteria group bacterium]
MIFQQYPPGQFPPKKRGEGYWYVHCEKGAVQVLQTREYIAFLKQTSWAGFRIDCIDGALLVTKEGDALWEELKAIAKEYTVMVYPQSFGATDYVKWTGNRDDCKRFDVIIISVAQPEE